MEKGWWERECEGGFLFTELKKGKTEYLFKAMWPHLHQDKQKNTVIIVI